MFFHLDPEFWSQIPVRMLRPHTKAASITGEASCHRGTIVLPYKKGIFVVYIYHITLQKLQNLSFPSIWYIYIYICCTCCTCSIYPHFYGDNLINICRLMPETMTGDACEGSTVACRMAPCESGRKQWLQFLDIAIVFFRIIFLTIPRKIPIIRISIPIIFRDLKG